MSNGISWGEVMNPLMDLSPPWLYTGLFLLFITFTLFGIMNVLTAVFVESAMTSTSHNRDLLVQEKEVLKKMYVSHMKEIFNQIDKDGSGFISLDEIEQIFADAQIGSLLEALEIEAYDARSMFKLLDVDDSGCVDINEFCDGCLRLKGDAKSYDIQCLMFESQRFMAKTKALMIRNEQAIGEIKIFMHGQMASIRASFADKALRLPKGVMPYSFELKEKSSTEGSSFQSRSDLLGAKLSRTFTGASEGTLASADERVSLSSSSVDDVPLGMKTSEDLMKVGPKLKAPSGRQSGIRRI